MLIILKKKINKLDSINGKNNMMNIKKYSTVSNNFDDFEKEIISTPIVNEEIKPVPKTILCFIRESNDRNSLNVQIKDKLSEVLHDSKFQYEDALYQFKFFIIRDEILQKKSIVTDGELSFLKEDVHPALKVLRAKIQVYIDAHASDATWINAFNGYLQRFNENLNKKINFSITKESASQMPPINAYINKFVEYLYKKGIFKAKINVENNVFKRIALKGNLHELTFTSDAIYINITRDEIISSIKKRLSERTNKK